MVEIIEWRLWIIQVLTPEYSSLNVTFKYITCVWSITTVEKKWYLNGVKQENTSTTFTTNGETQTDVFAFQQ